jgi:hypothetical protein
MRDKLYKVTLELKVSANWVEDGLVSSVVKRRIKDELPSMLCSHAYSNEIEVKNIKVKSIKR